MSFTATTNSSRKTFNMHLTSPVLNTPLFPKLLGSSQQQFSFDDEAILNNNAASCLHMHSIFESPTEQPEADSGSFSSDIFYASSEAQITRPSNSEDTEAAPRGRPESGLICDSLESASLWASDTASNSLREQDTSQQGPSERSSTPSDEATLPSCSSSATSRLDTHQPAYGQAGDEWQHYYQHPEAHTNIYQYSNRWADETQHEQQQQLVQETESDSPRSNAEYSISGESYCTSKTEQTFESAAITVHHQREQEHNGNQHQFEQQRHADEQRFESQRNHSYSNDQQFAQPSDCALRDEHGQQVVQYQTSSERDYYSGMQHSDNYMEPVVTHYQSSAGSSYNLSAPDHQTDYYHQVEEQHQHQHHQIDSFHQSCTTSQDQCYTMPVDHLIPLDQSAMIPTSEVERTYHVLEPQQLAYNTSNHYANQHDCSLTATSTASLAPQYQLLDDYESPTYQQLVSADYQTNDYASLYERPRDELPVVSEQYDPTIELNNCLRSDTWTQSGELDEEDGANVHECTMVREQMEVEDEGRFDMDESSASGSMQRSSSVASSLSDSRQSASSRRQTRTRTGPVKLGQGASGPSSSKPALFTGKSPLTSVQAREARQETLMKLRAFIERRIQLKAQTGSPGSQAARPVSSISRHRPVVAIQQHHSRFYEANSFYQSQPIAACPPTNMTGAYWPAQSQTLHQSHAGSSARVEVIHHYPLNGVANAARKASSAGSISACSASSIASDEEAQTANPMRPDQSGQSGGVGARSSSDINVEGSNEKPDCVSPQINQPFTRRRKRRNSVASTSVVDRNQCHDFMRRTRKEACKPDSNSKESPASPSSSASHRSRSLDDENEDGSVGVQTRASKRRKQQQQEQQQGPRQSSSPPDLIKYVPAAPARLDCQ